MHGVLSSTQFLVYRNVITQPESQVFEMSHKRYNIVNPWMLYPQGNQPIRASAVQPWMFELCYDTAAGITKNGRRSNYHSFQDRRKINDVAYIGPLN